MRKTTKISLCFIISLFICFSVWANATKGPNLNIIEPNYDAKEVLEGTIINHSFSFKNDGDTLLEITRVNPG